MVLSNAGPGERAAIIIANAYEQMYGERPIAVEFDELFEAVKSGVKLALEDGFKLGTGRAADFHELCATEFDSIGESGFENVIKWHDSCANKIRVLPFPKEE